MNVSSIISGLFGIVGFNQSTFPITLDSVNIESKSGLYFNRDFHSLATLTNIFNAQPDREMSDSDFNTYLEDMQKSAIMRVSSKLLQGKEELLENKVLFNYENVVTDTIDNDTSFVGYEIDIKKRKDIRLVLNRMLVEFDAIETFNIYVFHSSKQTPIKTISITTIANTSVDNIITDLEMSYSNYVGGKYYIGYLRSGLTAKAIRRDWNNSSLMMKTDNYIITPFIVPGHNVATLFDIDKVVYTGDTYGLNFDFSCYVDYTDVLIQNKLTFANAIGLQFVYNFMEQYISSPMINEHEQVIRDSIMQELSGEKPNGILNKLKMEIENVQGMFFYDPLIQIQTLR